MRFTRMTALVLTVAVPFAAHAHGPTPQAQRIADSFEQYEVTVYYGSPAKPNFQSKRGSLKFRTQIREGISQGVNFAGHYAIVVFGCGTNCSFGFLVDIKSGRIFDLPLGGEKNYGLLLDYRPNSKLLKARWIDAMGDIEHGDDNWNDHPMCVHQEFVLNGSAFKLLHQTKYRTKTVGACLT